MVRKLSIVIPIYNEVENLPKLNAHLLEALDGLELETWEAILVNDGSTDGSDEAIDHMHREDARFRPIHFKRNCGQTSAMDAGMRAARYNFVGTMDADMQNDPLDYALLLPHMKGNRGVVCGVRVRRQDTWAKCKASKFANWIRNTITHETITDTGCSLKLFRKDALDRIKLYEGMHRFLPTLIKLEGFDVVEVEVSHHPRFAGVSKYKILNRGVTAFFDLLAVRWMQNKQLHYEVKS